MLGIIPLELDGEHAGIEIRGGLGFGDSETLILLPAYCSQHGHHHRGDDAFAVLVPPPFEGLEIRFILHMICHA